MRQAKIVESDTQKRQGPPEDEILTVIQPNGTTDKTNEPKLDPGELVALYRWMVLNRSLDERMITLQRQGRIGFYIGSVGEEAAILGSAYGMRKQDWIFPCYREHGAFLMRGMPLKSFLCNLFGNEGDPIKGRQMPCHESWREGRVTSISSPLGTQIPQAVGAAWAAKLKKDDVAVLVYFGDGATSTNDFHTGMNFAGVYKAPCIMLCRNNQWAISMPLSRQTASTSIAVKAVAYGMTGVKVDGNDLLAMITATRQAVERARSGEGPTLIEALTYRVQGHSTSDDPRVYRKDDEVEPWRKKDPILRMRQCLEKKGLWDKAQDDKLREELDEEVRAAAKEAEALGAPPLQSITDDVFADKPWHLVEQQQEIDALGYQPGH